MVDEPGSELLVVISADLTGQRSIRAHGPDGHPAAHDLLEPAVGGEPTGLVDARSSVHRAIACGRRVP